MSVTATGTTELARLKAMQARTVAVRNALDKASVEMTTNEKQDRYEATGGNLTRLFAVEQSLGRNKVYSANISLTAQRLTMMQTALGGITADLSKRGVAVSQAGELGDVGTITIQSNAARSDLEATIGHLNTSVAGQALFAGARTDGAALAGADDILADIDALAGADAATTAANIDAYFTAPGGGFYARYLGSDTDVSPVAIGDGQSVDYGVTAVAPEIIAVLKGQAMAAVIAGGASGLSDAEKAALAVQAGNQLLEGNNQMLTLTSRVGMNQERVERAQAARVAETDVLENAQVDIIGVDYVEVAARVKNLETQLETIYTITSRLANLRFINFMS